MMHKGAFALIIIAVLNCSLLYCQDQTTSPSSQNNSPEPTDADVIFNGVSSMVIHLGGVLQSGGNPITGVPHLVAMIGSLFKMIEELLKKFPADRSLMTEQEIEQHLENVDPQIRSQLAKFIISYARRSQ